MRLVVRHFVAWFLATLAAGQWLSYPPPPVSQGTLREVEQHIPYCTINGTRYALRAPLPNLFIVGAQKAGTTALASVLSNHPGIEWPAAEMMSVNKSDIDASGGEVHFFDFLYPSLRNESEFIAAASKDRRCWIRHRYASYYYHKYDYNYHRRYSPHGKSERLGEQRPSERRTRLRLEKSPSYLISPHVPGAIRDVLLASDDDDGGGGGVDVDGANLHVIVLLRDPVERLLSQYSMITKRLRMINAKSDADAATNTTVGDASHSAANRSDVDHNVVDLLNREIYLLRHPVRTYLTSVFDPGGIATQSQGSEDARKLFDIPPAPAVGSERYASHYRWDDLSRAPSSFLEFEHLLQRGMYSVQLERWFHAFGLDSDDNGRLIGGQDSFRNPRHQNQRQGRPDPLIVIPYELFESHPRQVLEYLWKRLGIPRWDVSESILREQYGPFPRAVGEGEEEDGADEGEGDDDGEDWTEETATPTVINFLTEFYRPYNDRLADLLGEEWRGIWDPANSSESPGDEFDNLWKQVWLQKFEQYEKA
jgi:hypothetical protein